MKKIIFISLLSLISNLGFSAENTPCKIEAHTEAAKAFTDHYGSSVISTRSKFKPLIEDGKITHFVQISSQEIGSNEIISVTLNAQCKVLSIN